MNRVFKEDDKYESSSSYSSDNNSDKPDSGFTDKISKKIEKEAAYITDLNKGKSNFKLKRRENLKRFLIFIRCLSVQFVIVNYIYK